MNYIREMNAFFDWLETNPLDSSAQTLWFHLMAVANKSGWPEWFAVANPLLQAKVGISENSLTKHRMTLINKGRIEYKGQGKKNPGKYRLIPFASKNEVNEWVNHEVIRGVNHEVKGSALFNNKLNDTKLSGGDGGEIVDLNLAKAIKAIDAHFPARTNSLQTEYVVKLISEGFDPEIVVRSAEITRKKGKDIDYFWGILENCVERGIFTIAAFEEGQKRKKDSTQSGNQGDKASFFAKKAREAQQREGI
ncbi:hypothetical protein [Paenibacillus silviterrae]|uniref:hypothetical protein n=1 Tax=Paenibacillus silviterrae TaxID=3242194 RepID=UPI002542C6C1|nr:hypothetical protein [Paenibacillus chinjuensis]